MLETRQLHKRFDGFKAITEISLNILEGERHAIIGPNGAGKTTFFNLITGHLQPSAGEVRYKGGIISGLAPHKIVKQGLARSFQRINIYPRMTVFQNVQVALIAQHNQHLNFFTRAHNLHKGDTEDLLELVDLSGETGGIAGELAYGKQKQLELAIALAANPQMLLLDEPFAGIDPIAVYEVQKIVRRLKERGLGILITDHNAREMLKLVDRAYLIHRGRVLLEGAAEQLVEDPKAREIYLGPEFNI